MHKTRASARNSHRPLNGLGGYGGSMPSGITEETMMRSTIAAIAAIFLFAHAAAAQNFRSRSLTLVVAAAAGGTTDVLARIVAKRMGDDLGQSVVVENVPGGGATVGTRRVVRSEPDGYTLILGNMGSL